MAKEKERKFLIKYSDAMRLLRNGKLVESKYIEQKYISFGPEIRYRKEIVVGSPNHRHTLTIKGTSLNDRDEINIPITKRDYEEVVNDYGGIDVNSVSKTRMVMKLEDLIFEVDFFSKGLILVEVEFNSSIRMDSFIPPSYFGKEVTNIYGYKNVNLIENKEGRYVVK